MGFSQYPIITDELLSAYIDNAVSDDERAAVEAAIANDLEIAWRVESLRSTVSLLGQLTDVPLPRSFTLDEALLEMGACQRICPGRRCPSAFNRLVQLVLEQLARLLAIRQHGLAQCCSSLCALVDGLLWWVISLS